MCIKNKCNSYILCNSCVFVSDTKININIMCKNSENILTDHLYSKD